MDGEEVGECRISDGATYSRFDQSVRVTGAKGAVKGVIFDLDDTLYSEKEYVKSGFRAVSDGLGGGYEEKLWAYFEAGKPAIDSLLKELGQEERKAEVLSAYRGHKPDIRLYPGVTETLRDLKARGIKIGIITDGRPEGQNLKLEALNLFSLADDVIITDELGGAQFRKPCDIAFRIMQTKWRFHAEEIIYVGDNPVKDPPAPRQLGMQFRLFVNPEGLYQTADKYENYQTITAWRANAL